tara:strand:+ start:4773 stop:6872 length:2100 start_codon:yes stop_codon:yes gene_type:complete
MIKEKNNNNYIIHILLLIFSFLISLYLLGLNNLNFLNKDWLYLGDLSQYQIGWEFFRNDSWKFPLGSNLNYGLGLGSSIVFTDSIPLFAFIFKLLKNFLPENFQYFSTWIFLSIYLQLLLSYLIILSLTKNFYFSIIGMFFFILAPIFLQRSGIHLSQLGQWIILFSFYIELSNSKIKPILRGTNLILSSLINFYFTIMLLILNSLTYLFILIKKKSLYKKIVVEIILIYSLLFIIMYGVGYFMISPEDGLGGGYGYFNLNLNSFFNPTGYNNSYSFNWSILMPMLPLQNGEYEGFSYLGIGGFFLLFFSTISFFKKKKNFFISNKQILSIFIIFVTLSISNNINFGEINILSIDLNNYILGVLSSVRSSGRLIWPVYYLILILGIFFIFNYFSEKKRFIILISLLLIQLIDLSSGLKEYFKGKQYNYVEEKIFKSEDNFWDNLSSKITTLRSIEFKNKSELYDDLRNVFLNYNFKKTDIVYLARYSRKNIPLNNYSLVESFLNKDIDIFKKTAFLTKDLNIVRNIHFLYGKNLYYYFRNDIWIITNQYIVKPNNIESSKDNLEIKKIILNKKIDIIESNNLNYGFGWNKHSKGLASDGNYSSIIFKLDKKRCSDKFYLRLNVENYFDKIKKDFNLYLNNKILSKKNLNLIPLKINCKNIEDHYILKFEYKEPVSLRELKRGLNYSKRSIILKEIEIIN